MDITEPMNPSFESFTRKEHENILEFLRLASGTNFAANRSWDFWEWKHRSNPFGVSDTVLARDPVTRAITGTRLAMQWQLQCPGSSALRPVRFVDTATHPDYRRRKIFSTLSLRLLETLKQRGTPFIFNTPNPTSLAGYLKLGWQLVTDWPLYFQIQNPGFFDRRKETGPKQPSGGIPRWDEIFSKEIIPARFFFESAEDDLTLFLSQTGKDRSSGAYRTPRTLGYLRWRYGQHPHVPYGISTVKTKDRLLGFAIIRPNSRHGLKEGVVTEIFLAEQNTELAHDLLGQVAQNVHADYLVGHFNEGTLERDALLVSGYQPLSGQTVSFTVHPLNPCEPSPTAAASWDLSMGDLEIF